MVPARTAGQKAADLAMKAVATALFTTTVVSGVWFTATSISAVQHYNKLDKEARARKAAEEAARLEAEAAAEAKRKRAWRLW